MKRVFRVFVAAIATFLAFSILAALVLPRLIGKGEGDAHRSAKADLQTLYSLLDQFKLDCGRYPTTSEGLDALLVCPHSLKDKWRGPYARVEGEQFVDPWGNPYLYESHGSAFSLFCLGADGKVGGGGLDTDLVLTD